LNILGFQKFTSRENIFSQEQQKIFGIGFRQYVRVCIGEEYLKAKKNFAGDKKLSGKNHGGAPEAPPRPAEG
jgi:hypothetical protein